MTRFHTCQVSQFSCSISEYKSLLAPQSYGSKSHYQNWGCQAAVMTGGNLGNPIFLRWTYVSYTYTISTLPNIGNMPSV